jgi:hypothetical protein
MPTARPAKARERNADTVSDLARAEQALARKDIVGAERVATKTQLKDSSDPDLNAFVIWVRVLGGGLKGPIAVEELSSILLDAPDCIRARLYRGKIHKRENKMREAIADLEQVTVDDPGNKEAASELRLLALMVKGRF